MTRQRRDTDAHHRAAEKITFEKELCGDLVNKYLRNVPADRRADVRLALEHVIIELYNVWCRWPGLKDEKGNRLALLRLIRAAFDRWTKGDFVRPLVLHQLATNPKNSPKNITYYVNEKRIGIQQLPRLESQIKARRDADRQELSRRSRPYRNRSK
jgi:hypothetical protein